MNPLLTKEDSNMWISAIEKVFQAYKSSIKNRKFHGFSGNSIINATISQGLIDHHFGDKIKIKEKMKKKSNLMIVILIIVAIIGFLSIVLEKVNLTSDYVMIYPKLSTNSITITRPESSSSWNVGESEWVYYDISLITNVDIEFYKNGIFVMEIGAALAGTSAVLWSIPSDLVSSDQYQIKVIDYYDSSLYDFSDFFEIKNPQHETPGIPGYILYLLIGVICTGSLISAICMLVILKRKKHKNS